jgi:sugar lactone lactonase YvrE
MRYKLDVALDSGALLGEGPCWDVGSGILYWIDGLGRSVHAFDPSTGTDRMVCVDQFVGCVNLREAGGLIVALEHGFYQLDFESGSLSLVANPEAAVEGNRFNDGKCDSHGRLWCGSMSLKENEGAGLYPPAGAFYRLTGDGAAEKMFGPVGISNGLGWDRAERTMYYIDSPTRKVDAFDFDAEAGTLANRRTVVMIPEGWGLPDGMCVDADGMLWVALWGGARVTQWDPSNGALLDTIEVPVPNVTCCAFGGQDLAELYVTTSRVGLDADGLVRYPHAGALFVTRPGIHGLPAHRFQG